MTQEDSITSAFEKQYKEAMKNPSITMYGHISNENGVTNDYRGRAIYEFFQNAIDRAESKIWIHLDKQKKRLIIANDGQPFSIESMKEERNKNYSDFESLCSINASSKNQNESIGNKGVGFKSCWEYTDKISICSIHNGTKWGFNLYNPLNITQLKEFKNLPIKEVIEWLDNEDYAAVIKQHKKLPSFYFPERITHVDTYFSENLQSASTIITFHDLPKASIDDLDLKIKEFSEQQIFFVQQLEKLKGSDVILELKVDASIIKELHTKVDEEQWLVAVENFDEKVTDKSDLIALSEALNYKIENPKIAIAFPLKGQGIRSKFYCYLPTEIGCGFNVLIHADFLLDVSRKQIDFKNNPYNIRLLDHIATMLVDTFTHPEKQKKLLQLPHFAEFINPSHTVSELKEAVWRSLKEEITPILRSVYTQNHKGDESYSLIFDAMKHWTKERENRARKAEYYHEAYDHTIQYFCDEEIFIVPTGNETVSALPKRDNADKKLFYKGGSDQEFTIPSEIIEHFENIAISDFDELDSSELLRKLNIVKPYSTIEIVRALLDKNASEEKNTAVLKFIYQIRETLSQSKSDDLSQLLFQIKLPCIDNKWQQAQKCFYGLDQNALGLNEKGDVYALDMDRLNKYLEHAGSDICGFLDILGCWSVLPLRIKGKQTELPWTGIPKNQDSEKIKHALNKALPKWEALGFNLEKVQQQLKEQAWFFDAINSQFVSPKRVFLFNDQRQRNCIAQEYRDKQLDDLYDFLGIKLIIETDDPNKLFSQITQMSMMEHIDDHHKTVYKQCVLKLSGFKELPVNIMQLPLLTTSGHYINNHVREREKLWFVPKEQNRYKHHFDIQFVNFDPDTPQSFIAELNNVAVFNPEYLLKPDKNDLGPDPHKLKEEIETKWLAKIFALAESILSTSVFDKNDSISRWNNLKIQYAEDVWIELSLSDIKPKPLYEDGIGRSERNDVLFKPLSQDVRNRNKDQVGDIIYDLQNPLENNYFYKFGYVISDAVFRNIAFGDVLANFFQKALLSKENSRPEFETDFLSERGVYEHDIMQMQEFITSKLLSPEDKQKLVDRLNKIPALNGLDFLENNWNNISFYFKLNSELSFTEIIKVVEKEEKLKSAVEQLNPRQHNLNLIYNSKEDIKLKVFISKRQTLDDNDFSEIIRSLTDEALYQYNFKIDDLYSKFGIDKTYEDIDLALARIKLDNDIANVKFTSPEKLNYSQVKNNIISNEGNGKISARMISAANREKTRHEQSCRGIGVEKVLALHYANEVIIHEQVEILKGKMKCINFPKNPEFSNLLENAQSLEEISEILQVSKSIGDGLGYDVLQPVFKEKELTEILKVEVKSSEEGQKIHLSESERQKIIYFCKNNENSWRLYHYFGNNKQPIDRTEAIKKAVCAHKENYKGDQLLAAESWLIEFEKKQ